jgi:hypothetical protein
MATSTPKTDAKPRVVTQETPLAVKEHRGRHYGGAALRDELRRSGQYPLASGESGLFYLDNRSLLTLVRLGPIG